MANTGWNQLVAGPVMLLASGDDPLSAAVVLPEQTDSTLSVVEIFHLDSLSKLVVDLFGRGRTMGQSGLVVATQQPGDGCIAWPVARLSGSVAKGWRVGFERGRAKPVPLDSIEGMSSGDSTTITNELVRIASAATASGDQSFQGLPFTVQKAYRMSFGTISVLVGNIVRKINEEDNPREERLLLVAERSESTRGSYVGSFQSRSAGTEDAVRTNGLLAALSFVQTNTPALVISFRYEEGGQVALLERVANHEWKITWKSAYTGC